MGSRSEAARKAWVTRRGSAGRPKTTAGGKRILYQGSSRAQATRVASKFKGLSHGGWVKRLGKTGLRMSGAPKGLTTAGYAMWLKG